MCILHISTGKRRPATEAGDDDAENGGKRQEDRGSGKTNGNGIS